VLPSRELPIPCLIVTPTATESVRFGGWPTSPAGSWYIYGNHKKLGVPHFSRFSRSGAFPEPHKVMTEIQTD
jgi:hypothetical protein